MNLQSLRLVEKVVLSRGLGPAKLGSLTCRLISRGSFLQVMGAERESETLRMSLEHRSHTGRSMDEGFPSDVDRRTTLDLYSCHAYVQKGNWIVQMRLLKRCFLRLHEPALICPAEPNLRLTLLLRPTTILGTMGLFADARHPAAHMNERRRNKPHLLV